MDDEDMLEAIYEFSSQVSCHDDQEDLQHVENLQPSTVSLLDEDEINQELDVDIHVPSLDIGEVLQLVCQFLFEKGASSELVHIDKAPQLQED